MGVFRTVYSSRCGRRSPPHSFAECLGSARISRSIEINLRNFCMKSLPVAATNSCRTVEQRHDAFHSVSSRKRLPFLQDHRIDHRNVTAPRVEKVSVPMPCGKGNSWTISWLSVSIPALSILKTVEHLTVSATLNLLAAMNN